MTPEEVCSLSFVVNRNEESPWAFSLSLFLRERCLCAIEFLSLNLERGECRAPINLFLTRGEPFTRWKQLNIIALSCDVTQTPPFKACNRMTNSVSARGTHN